MEVLANVLTNKRLYGKYEPSHLANIGGFAIDEKFAKGVSNGLKKLANYKRFGLLFSIDDCKECGFDRSVGLEITRLLNHVVDEIRRLDSPDSEPAYTTYVKLLQNVIKVINRTPQPTTATKTSSHGPTMLSRINPVNWFAGSRKH